MVAEIICMPSAESLYLLACHKVYDGMPVSPRGLPTREIRNITLQLTNPARSVMNNQIRLGYHPAIGVAEGLQMIAGVSFPDLMERIAPAFSKIREEDGHLHGAYGPRLIWQTGEVIKKLQEDPDSRQAVAAIWDPVEDSMSKAKDIPCTVDLQFSIRYGKLLLDTHMRSEDVWLGLPYDLLQFTMLQATVAAVLGLRAGTYTHYVSSFHVYERDLIKLPVGSQVPQKHLPEIGHVPGEDWPEASRHAMALLTGLPVPETKFTAWCQRLLSKYVEARH